MLYTGAKVQQARLHQQRAEVLAELNRLQEIMLGELDLEPDEGDAQIGEHETAAILMAMLEQKLQEIDAALCSIRLGQYGRCDRCGKPIEPARLAAKPYACYCITCQEIVERAMHEASVAQTSAAASLSPIAASWAER